MGFGVILESSIRFYLKIVSSGASGFPLSVHFTKTNYGTGTPDEDRKEYSKVKRTLSKSRDRYTSTYIEDSTLYRGIHTMRCEVYDASNTLLFRDWIGVFIHGKHRKALSAPVFKKLLPAPGA